MAGNLKVTFQDLQTASGQLNKGETEIDNILSTMRSQLEPIHASWEGASRVQFDQLWQEWDRGAGQLKESLLGIAKLLSTAANAYEQTEEQIRNSMG